MKEKCRIRKMTSQIDFKKYWVAVHPAKGWAKFETWTDALKWLESLK